MAICKYTDICPFFAAEIGYSPEMYQKMKQGFCLEDNTHCVRLIAISTLSIEDVPDDLLPTDAERLEELTRNKGLHR